jgi:hypothetical protein
LCSGSPRGFGKGRSSSDDGRRVARRGAGCGEDRSLKAFLAQAAHRDLRHRHREQRGKQRDGSARRDERAEHERVVAAATDVRLEAAEAVADVADDGVESCAPVPVAQAASSQAATGTGPRFVSAGCCGGSASRTSSRSRSRRSTSRWRATGTGSYSMPTTRSIACERRSASAGDVSHWVTSTWRSGAARASLSSTPGSNASAGVCTNARVHKLDLPCKMPIQQARLASPRTGRITPKNSEVDRRMALPSPAGNWASVSGTGASSLEFGSEVLDNIWRNCLGRMLCRLGSVERRSPFVERDT